MVIRIRKAALGAAALLCMLMLGLGRSGLFPAAAIQNNTVLLPILMYHEIAYQSSSPLVITPWELESDLQYFARSGYTPVCMEQLIRYADGEGDLPEKPVMITFDDGYLNNYVYALPLLKKYGVRAVLSLIAKDTDDFTASRSDNLHYSHVTWEQVLHMQNSGCFEIENHSYNLHSTRKGRYGSKRKPGESEQEYEKVLTRDLLRCQEEIYSHTGIMPTTFTYPYGAVSPESVAVVKKLGFRASLSCKYGVNLIKRDPDFLYCLMRISRYHGVSVQKTLTEALRTLKYRKTG